MQQDVVLALMRGSTLFISYLSESCLCGWHDYIVCKLTNSRCVRNMVILRVKH